MYPPPRPMQMSMGMVMGGGQNMQMMQQGQAAEQKPRPEPIHLQVKPRSITLTPGVTPISVKTPSATVIVANSKERLKGDKSQHKSVVIEQLNPPQAGTMNMQMGSGGQMGYMMGQYPSYPGCHRPPGMMPMVGSNQTMGFRTPSGTIVMSQSIERLHQQQQQKPPMEPISLQVGRGGIRVTPGGNVPIALKTPSTTVIVNNSWERLQRDSISRTMSPTAMHRTSQRGQSQSGLAVLATLLGGGTNVHVATGSRDGMGGPGPVMAHRTPSTTVFMSTSSECLHPSRSGPMPRPQGRRSLSRSELSASLTVPVQVAAPKKKAPIVMSQPLTGGPLEPQMQEVVLTGMTDYTATVVLILTPEEGEGK